MDVKQLQSFTRFSDDKLKKHNLFETLLVMMTPPPKKS